MAEPLNATVLVVDDERLVRWSLKQRLEDDGHQVLEAADGAEAMRLFVSGVDLVLLDHRLPDADGIELLQRMLEDNPDVPVIMITAHANVEQAVSAMKLGAHHYTAKPFDLDQVSLLTQRALETTRLRRRLTAMNVAEAAGVEDIIGESAPMQRCKELLTRIATSPASTVLLTGESGTGKDLAARSIHRNSQRADGPFINITCSALTATLLESELFGHERGAFTDAKARKKGLLEMAHGGTVFLDEIGEMEPGVQAKLLRFLEEKAFRRVGGATDIRANVRVIAATNIDLAQAVREKSFREDLYYRLAVLTVELPPLRDRRGDVPLLLEHFIERFNREFHKHVTGVAPAALAGLQRYGWPGNVRELRNSVERALLLSDGPELTAADFAVLEAQRDRGAAAEIRLPPEGLDFVELERRLVRQALEMAEGNRTQAAALLGMNRDQIRYRIEKFGLED